MFESHWYEVKDADPRGLALYRRHYSHAINGTAAGPGFVGVGQKLVLLTSDARAVFAWLRNTAPRWDNVNGPICTIFRNEGETRSSELITEAVELARSRWPGETLYTYVSPAHIRSANPGYCFKVCGFRRIGVSGRGLHLLALDP